MTLERLRAAARLTEDMLQAAERGEWEALAQLERQRQAQLEHLELGGQGDVAEGAALELLQRIQSMNRELLALSQAERNRVKEALLAMRRGGKARQAYR